MDEVSTPTPMLPPPSEAEVRVVEYLKEHVRPRERVVVSQLYNEVFTGDVLVGTSKPVTVRVSLQGAGRLTLRTFPTPRDVL